MMSHIDHTAGMGFHSMYVLNILKTLRRDQIPFSNRGKCYDGGIFQVITKNCKRRGKVGVIILPLSVQTNQASFAVLFKKTRLLSENDSLTTKAYHM